MLKIVFQEITILLQAYFLLYIAPRIAKKRMETLSVGLCWRNTGYSDLFAVIFVVCKDDVIGTNTYFVTVFGNQSESLYFVFTKSQRASMRLY